MGTILLRFLVIPNSGAPCINNKKNKKLRLILPISDEMAMGTMGIHRGIEYDFLYSGLMRVSLAWGPQVGGNDV